MYKYAIIREDRVPFPNPINVAHNSDTALQNGAILGVKGFKAGEREVYDVGTVAAGDMIAILVSSTLQYDDRLGEGDFALEKGKAGKANYVARGEVYTIAKTMVTGIVVVGDKLKAKVGGNALEKSADGVDAIAVVRRVVNFEGQDSLQIEFL